MPFPNDEFQREKPCVADMLDGPRFWSEKTPNEPSLFYPRTPTDESMECVKWSEFEGAIQLAAQDLQTQLGLSASAPKDKRTITLLIAPTHDNVCLWIALARMGYSTQFISLAHMPNVIASLITRSQSSQVVHGGLDDAWLQDSKKGVPAEQTKWHALQSHMSLNGLLDRVRAGEQAKTPSADAPRPSPFVVLHSFGSTSMPKLYPVQLASANISAQDAAHFWIAAPSEQRWRRQLQTSLCFHFSFQQPVWRALTCGTALVFPAIRANGNLDASSRGHNAKGGVVLVPNPTDVLDSLALAKADVLYASPTSLENVALTVLQTDNTAWKQAFAGLKEAHTGGAPVSRQMADTYTSAGLNVMQVFATTEAGMLFIGKPAITGHLCNLTPRPQLKDKMLFHQPDASSDILELWLPKDFPGLQKDGLKFVPFPGDSSIEAWNTCDTFSRLPIDAPLYHFRGRTDDWLRLTSGTACRALEIEHRLTEILRERTSTNSDKGSPTPGSPATADMESLTASTSTLSTNDHASSNDNDNDDDGLAHVEAVTALGNGRKTLSAVVQLRGHAKPTQADVEAVREAAQIVTEEQLQYPAVLAPDAILFADAETPIHITQKGSLQRKQNEQTFAPQLDARGL